MKRSLMYFTVLCQVFIFSALPAFAEEDPSAIITGGLNAAASGSGLNNSIGLTALMGRLISVVLGLLGIIFLFYLVLAGITYMTAAGDDKKTSKAKDSIKTAVIGMVLTISAYAISSFVIQALATAVTGP